MSTRLPKLPTWASNANDNVQPTSTEIQDGWPLSQTPPSRQRFNWFFNLVHNAVAYLTRRGISDWADDEDYLIGDKAMGSDLKTYIAIQPSLNKDPISEPTYWAPWALTQDDADDRYALKNGKNTETFAIAKAGSLSHAARYSQILPTGSFAYIQTTPGVYASAITIPPFSKVRVFLQAGGGGGGASDEEGVVTQDSTPGGATIITHATTGEDIIFVEGGGRGRNATRYGTNTYELPTTPVVESNTLFPTVSYKNTIFSLIKERGVSFRPGGLYHLQKPADMSGTGTGGAGYPGTTNIAGSTAGNGGAYFEGLIVNNTANPMPLTITVGAGGQKTISVWGQGVDGLPGSVAIQVEET